MPRTRIASKQQRHRNSRKCLKQHSHRRRSGSLRTSTTSNKVRKHAGGNQLNITKQTHTQTWSTSTSNLQGAGDGITRQNGGHLFFYKTGDQLVNVEVHRSYTNKALFIDTVWDDIESHSSQHSSQHKTYTYTQSTDPDWEVTITYKPGEGLFYNSVYKITQSTTGIDGDYYPIFGRPITLSEDPNIFDPQDGRALLTKTVGSTVNLVYGANKVECILDNIPEWDQYDRARSFMFKKTADDTTFTLSAGIYSGRVVLSGTDLNTLFNIST
jgi:hypothetical protein